MVFEPKENCLACPYCGHKQSMPKQLNRFVDEQWYEHFVHASAAQLQALAANALEVTCTGCAATVTFTPPEVAGECAFCGTKIVAQPKSADPTIAPAGVLPFKVTQNEATDHIRQWISSRWFAPSALKKFATQDGIGGVYLPFWTYDSQTRTQYTGERGEYYYTTETYTTTENGQTVTRERQVRHTRWYFRSGTVERFFDDVLIPATKSLPVDRLKALEPWDLSNIKPYDPAFLAGYKAQRYQCDLKEGFISAQGVMAPIIESDIRKDIGGDEQRISSVDTSYENITFKHILLPVYLAAYRFNDKTFQVMVNARTGEVQGERPYSAWKIALFVMFILAIIGTLIYLFR